MEFTSLYVAPVSLIVYTQKHACIEIIYFTCPVQHCFSAYVFKNNVCVVCAYVLI